MRILIFGGTRFLGRAIAEAALRRGHALTLFHRGRSHTGLFPEAEHVIGDRESDLGLLGERTFDAVIDTCGFEVFSVRKTARVIGSARPYVFVSSISVYGATPVQNAESASLTLESYGGLKEACERALEEELPGRVLSVRAGKIDGPHDLDERFHWWLSRIARGGDVIAPGRPDARVQNIDVRDLARWIVLATERGETGTMNATGETMTMRVFLETIRDVIGSSARFVWVPDDVLVRDGVKPYSEMPYWIPNEDFVVPIDDAKRTGLELRPFADTVRDTWAWMQSSWAAEARVRAMRRLAIPAGIDEAREAKLRTGA